ncbi:hypothetical protein V6N13_125180 [Hibiscus sabdariffa]
MPQHHNQIMPGNNLNARSQCNQDNFFVDPRNNKETLAEYKEKNDTSMQNLASLVRNLEVQMGKMANARKRRPQGTLPSDTEDSQQTQNEQCKAVTLRRGKNTK